MIQFTEDFLIGIPEIDREHKKLFVMLEQADERVRSDADIRTTAMELLKGLQDYAATHFLMKRIIWRALTIQSFRGRGRHTRRS